MADDLTSSLGPSHRPYLALAPLLRAGGIASDAKKMILAVVGLLALSSGWDALSLVFGGRTPNLLTPKFPFDQVADSPADLLLTLAWRVSEPARILATPFVGLFARGVGPAAWFCSASMALWAVVVWGLAGGAIARIAVVQVACGQRVGLGSAIRFAARKSGSLIGAPLIPFLAVSLFVAFCAGFGLLYRIPLGIGAMLAAVLWFLPLLSGLIVTMILAGLAVGWPLMHATIAAEDEDAPDALSRSYSYVNQRLGRYLVHAAAAWVIGTVSLALVLVLARMVVGVAEWGVALGAPGPDETATLARSIRSGWISLIGLFAHGWAYSFFWTSASIIYLILRRDVDGTEWADVALPEHAADAFADDPASESAPKPVEARA